MTIIELIPFSSFQEKIKITREYSGRAKIEIWEGYIYTQREIGRRQMIA